MCFFQSDTKIIHCFQKQLNTLQERELNKQITNIKKETKISCAFKIRYVVQSKST